MTDIYEIPINSKEYELIIWAVKLFYPHCDVDYLLNKPIVKPKDKNHLIKLALINLFRQQLTMIQLNFIYETIPLLPRWLQPYK
jgi:hypothetical protein